MQLNGLEEKKLKIMGCIMEEMKKRSRLRRVLLSQSLGCDVNRISEELGTQEEKSKLKSTLKGNRSNSASNHNLSLDKIRVYTDSSIFSKVSFKMIITTISLITYLNFYYFLGHSKRQPSQRLLSTFCRHWTKASKFYS